MPNQFLEFVAGNRRGSMSGDGSPENGYSISLGKVENNIDFVSEGRVTVRLPGLPAFPVFARLCATGGGGGRGFLWVPEVDDEVLVAFNKNDERDAYVLGGLWSTIDRPPLILPTDFIIKRVIKTGKKGGVGHEIEFDDLLQSIKITSSTQQKVTIDPTMIELSTTGGSVSVKLDLTSQTVSITAPVKIELKATEISLQGATVDIEGGQVNIQAGTCSIQGGLVKIN
ncbi:MAG: phage baseplate assembly protein V [Blastocatellia bacterium]